MDSTDANNKSNCMKDRWCQPISLDILKIGTGGQRQRTCAIQQFFLSVLDGRERVPQPAYLKTFSTCCLKK